VAQIQHVTRLAAYGLVEREGLVLLARAGVRSDLPGTWWLPGGGVEHGEHPEQAVVRELQEETGLAVRVAGEPAILSDLLDIRARGILMHSVRLCYPLVVEAGELRAEVDGTTDDVAWVSRERVASLSTLPFVRRALGLPAPDPGRVVVIDAGRLVDEGPDGD